MSPCERIAWPGGSAIICGRGRTRTICDVCDATVPARRPKVRWRGVEIDLCAGCERCLKDDPEYRAFAAPIVAKHYPEFALTEVAS